MGGRGENRVFVEAVAIVLDPEVVPGIARGGEGEVDVGLAGRAIVSAVGRDAREIAVDSVERILRVEDFRSPCVADLAEGQLYHSLLGVASGALGRSRERLDISCEAGRRETVSQWAAVEELETGLGDRKIAHAESPRDLGMGRPGASDAATRGAVETSFGPEIVFALTVTEPCREDLPRFRCR